MCSYIHLQTPAKMLFCFMRTNLPPSEHTKPFPQDPNRFLLTWGAQKQTRPLTQETFQKGNIRSTVLLKNTVYMSSIHLTNSDLNKHGRVFSKSVASKSIRWGGTLHLTSEPWHHQWARKQQLLSSVQHLLWVCCRHGHNESAIPVAEVQWEAVTATDPRPCADILRLSPCAPVEPPRVQVNAPLTRKTRKTEMGKGQSEHSLPVS